MGINQLQREQLVDGAEAAFIEMSRELDNLFKLTTFYLDRYPDDGSRRDGFITQELQSCISELTVLPQMLAEVVTKWKLAQPRVISREGVEVNIINEMWANIQALIYFLTSHNISLDTVDLESANSCWRALLVCNRML